MRFPAGTPIVIVNYKAYPGCVGKRAVEVTRQLAHVAAGRRVTLAVAVQAADILRVAQASEGVLVLAQHVDPLLPGNGTGSTLAEAVAEAGAVGSLVNHAERRLTLADIDSAISRLRAMGLASVVCTNSASATRGAAALRPDFVAIEPPELIGGKVSVTSADPEIVRASAKLAKEASREVRVLCGAGVKTGDDLAAALRLGADGVLLASGVVKAMDPEGAMRALLERL